MNRRKKEERNAGNVQIMRYRRQLTKWREPIKKLISWWSPSLLNIVHAKKAEREVKREEGEEEMGGEIEGKGWDGRGGEGWKDGEMEGGKGK